MSRERKEEKTANFRRLVYVLENYCSSAFSEEKAEGFVKGVALQVVILDELLKACFFG